MTPVQNLSSFSEDSVLNTVSDELEYIKEYFSVIERPHAVLLAGQPGAGKTVLSSLFSSQDQGNSVFINADNFRRYHPNYDELYRQYGSDSVSHTVAFSSAVTNRLIQEVSSLKMNLIIEGTGRTTKVPIQTSELLVSKGYTVELAVIATRPTMSLASTLIRFYQMNAKGTIPRATAIEAHDITVSALPGNLDILMECNTISRISIWDRERALLFDSDFSRMRPSEVLTEYWSRPWSSEEFSYMEQQIEELWLQEEACHLNQGKSIAELQRRFQTILDEQDESFSGPTMGMY